METTARNEGPLERSSKFLKSQLLECEATTTSSLGAKCVCHYSTDRLPARQPAPPGPDGRPNESAQKCVPRPAATRPANVYTHFGRRLLLCCCARVECFSGALG